MSCREREKSVAVEKPGQDMAPWILSLLCFTTGSRRVAATGHCLNDLSRGGGNNRVVLPNRPEAALLSFLDADAAVGTYSGGSDEKVSGPGKRGRVSVCQSAVHG
jgi:hypothetical protein